MEKHFILPKEFFSTASRLSIKTVTALLFLILCIGIAPAWGAEHGAIFYVNGSAAAGGDGTSWATAFTDLQDALDAAVPGDEIWVAVGTYTPTETIGGSSDPRMAAFILKSGVSVYGGFTGDENQLNKRQLDPSLTILSGDPGTPNDDTDNSYHVVYANGVTDAVFDGFTVTGGRGDGEGNGHVYQGAGMYNYNSALTVTNCTFSDNQVAVTTAQARGYGGGMYNYSSATIVTNCTFSNNWAGNSDNHAPGFGGGMYNYGYFTTSENDLIYPSVTACTFSNNIAEYGFTPMRPGGGGMYNEDCDLTVDSCTFTGNLGCDGGGILINSGRPTITNCIFNNNSNNHTNGCGGAIYDGGASFINNCDFYNNGSEPLLGEPYQLFTIEGGAIFDSFSSGGSTVTNCIFIKNQANSNAGAFLADGRNTTLMNSLFYGNTVLGTGHPDVCSFSTIYTSRNNLVGIDPLLVDPDGGDFHLSYDSPCIDTGSDFKYKNNWYSYRYEVPTTDFYGNKRVVDGDGDGVPAIDIGVNEFIPNLPDLGIFLQDLADDGELDGTTPLDDVDNAQAALDQNDKDTAISILNQLITDVETLLGDTDTAQLIEGKTEAVIENLD